MTVTKIRGARDVEEILSEALADQRIDEVMIVAFYRDDKGARQCKYDYSRMRSRFRMGGAMIWAANALLAEPDGS